MFREVAPKVADRPGGYVRIIRMGYRPGDNSEMAMIELVDFNTIYTGNGDKPAAGAPKKRTRRGAAKKKADGTEAGAEGAEATGGDDAPKAKAPRKKAAPKADGEEKPKAPRKKKSDDEK